MATPGVVSMPGRAGLGKEDRCNLQLDHLGPSSRRRVEDEVVLEEVSFSHLRLPHVVHILLLTEELCCLRENWSRGSSQSPALHHSSLIPRVTP